MNALGVSNKQRSTIASRRAGGSHPVLLIPLLQGVGDFHSLQSNIGNCLLILNLPEKSTPLPDIIHILLGRATSTNLLALSQPMQVFYTQDILSETKLIFLLDHERINISSACGAIFWPRSTTLKRLTSATSPIFFPVRHSLLEPNPEKHHTTVDIPSSIMGFGIVHSAAEPICTRQLGTLTEDLAPLLSQWCFTAASLQSWSSEDLQTGRTA
ncbi:hypothetical protein P153DRAFT_215204 [Dothidotthia symphoricarpi CBS 119687]|uniref:Uncharacterized protein n=1 Tax=Dothidotthia symphoricarpi CBS 119687 TaxID=1392245 RepID=A0A6A6AHA1_9PLEO|nr:uncharacterized protein P153DRAFT_215204 [Dothidotthia symphoricarpi CBS 119687]KAF2130284.1 hypothetical protein P153DRAFT_215204 [Dothidotthia symphoricarpi CBS 119687]